MRRRRGQVHCLADVFSKIDEEAGEGDRAPFVSLNGPETVPSLDEIDLLTAKGRDSPAIGGIEVFRLAVASLVRGIDTDRTGHLEDFLANNRLRVWAPNDQACAYKRSRSKIDQLSGASQEDFIEYIKAQPSQFAIKDFERLGLLLRYLQASDESDWNNDFLQSAKVDLVAAGLQDHISCNVCA